MTSSPRDVSQGLRNAAAIRQELPRLIKIAHCSVVILQTSVVIEAFGMERFAKVGLQSEGGFSCLASLVAKRRGLLKSEREVAAGINVRQERPSQREVGIQPDRLPKMFLSVESVSGSRRRLQRKSQAPQIGIIRLRIIRRLGRDDFFFLAGEL